MLLLVVIGCSVDQTLARLELELGDDVLQVEAEAEGGRCVDMRALEASTLEGIGAEGYREAIEGFVDDDGSGCWSRAFFEFDGLADLEASETVELALTGRRSDWVLSLDNYPLAPRALTADQVLDSGTIEGATITFTLDGPGVLSPGAIRITDDDQGDSQDSASIDDAAWTDTTVVIEVPDELDFNAYLVVFEQPWSHDAQGTELDVRFATRFNAPVY